MKKSAPVIAGILLGLLFVMSAVVVLFNLAKAPPPPESSPSFHIFVTGGEGVFNPMIIVIVALALYLLWVERKRFAGLIH